MRVRELAGSGEAAWDAFVRAHPRGSPFHLLAWKRSIEEVFGYRPMYLAAGPDAAIEAVLPLFLVNNPLMGKVLLSSPFAVYGGVLATSEQAREALARHVRELGEKLGVDYVELRNAWPEQKLGFAPVARYVTFLQEIGPDEDKILEAIPRKTRYMVRKALKRDYASRLAADQRGFFDLYTQSLRRLGTPAFPRRHFEALARHFGPEARITEVLLEGKLAAAVMSFTYQDRILPYYGASDPAFNEAAPNNFMYFDLMRQAGAEGFRVFDFGRSKKAHSGSYDFKAHWGMEMLELPYEVLLVRRKELPNFSPNNARLQWAIRAWQHVPLPVTRMIGPWLVKLVP